MRRRPIILLLLATAALMGAAIALADAPTTGPAVKALGETPDSQVGPSVAVNPAGGSNVPAVVVGTDWSNGVLKPQSAFATGSIAAASGTPTWNPQAILPHTTGPFANDVSGGSPDVAWGPGNKVYAVELARPSADPTNVCRGEAGLFMSVSSNGGASWGTPFQLDENGPAKMITDPSIAYNASTGRIFVTYTTMSSGCPDANAPDATSVIDVMSPNDTGTGSIPIRVVSTAGTSFRNASVATLADGSIAVAYYDASRRLVLATTCRGSAPPPTNYCNTLNPWVVASASPPPNFVQGLSVDVHPRIAADATGRVVVTWAAQTPSNNADVFSATSRDGGMTFGSPQRVPADGGTADQIDPSVEISADGRADIAFLDSEFGNGGFRVAASSSNRPIGSSTREQWTRALSLESAPIVPVQATSPGPPTLGGRLGIAELPRSTGLPAWTLVSWADTRNVGAGAQLNSDVYSTVQLHGTTTPVAAATDPRSVPKNRQTTFDFTSATDADGDPPTYSIVQDGSQLRASIPDPNAPTLVYNAPNALVSDQVKVNVSDGVSSSTMTINLQVVNTPPVITCTSLDTPIDKPLAIPASTCAQDENGDPLTLDATAPSHGKITRPGGVLTFVPDAGFEGAAAVTLTANDGLDTSAPRSVTIEVGTSGGSPVVIDGASVRSTYTDRPILLSAKPLASSVDGSKIQWRYGDEKTTDQGRTISHLFPTVGTYEVRASLPGGPDAVVTVLVQTPPLAIERTDLGTGGSMAVRVQLAAAGKLSLRLLGVRGARQRTVKLSRGTHTVAMKVPARARSRGTVMLKLALSLPNGRSAKLKRAVLVPPS